VGSPAALLCGVVADDLAAVSLGITGCREFSHPHSCHHFGCAGQLFARQRQLTDHYPGRD